MASLAGLLLPVAGTMADAVTLGAFRRPARPRPVQASYRHTIFDRIIAGIVGNPVLPIATIATVLALAFTPSLLVLRIWLRHGLHRTAVQLEALVKGADNATARGLVAQAGRCRDRLRRRDPPAL